MAKFIDMAGREWVLRLTVGSLRDVRERAGVDLKGALQSPERIVDLIFGDVERTLEMLWALVEGQAGARGVDAAAFAAGLDGAALEAALEALVEALVDFFPRSRVAQVMRTHLRATLARMDEAAVGAMQKAMAEATQSEPSTSSGTAGTSPGSQGSTPGPSPCGS